MNHLISFTQNLAYVIVIFVVLYIIKLIADWRTKAIDDDYEIGNKKNLAIALRRLGLYLGVTIALIGAITGSTQGFFKDIIALAFDGIVIIPLMFIARLLNDAIMLYGINNDEAARSGNVAVGFAEAGSYVASGLILYGAFTGEGGGVLSALVFYALGQLSLIVFYLIYQAVTPFNVTTEIKSGNSAAGIAVMGILVALGLILKSSITGPFVSWVTDLTSFGLSLAMGIVFLLVARKAVDWLFLPNTTIAVEVAQDKNNAALTLTAGIIVAAALIVSTVI